MTEASSEEVIFQNKISEIVNSHVYDSVSGISKASKELNEFLFTINKINVGRDLVAHVFEDADKSIKVDIFCRNERIDELGMKLEYLLSDAVKNKDLIVETRAYIEEITRIGKFQ
jgi:hypothetical protein